MAFVDSKTGKIVCNPPKPCADYPDWIKYDCGCCGGILWGGEYPRDCGECLGSGVYYKHKSGMVAMYPGGPFLGRKSAEAAGGE